MTATDFDVIVNGGGPVGMGLAIDLGLRGLRTCVVERHPSPQPIPKGQNLTQRTTEHFHAWGCEAALRAAHPIPEGSGIGGMTSYGTLLSGWNYDWLNRAKVRDFYHTANARLPQYATEGVLRARAAELPKVTVLTGQDGIGLEQDADSVALTLRNRDDGAEQSLSARYLVGCDGSRSMVREAAGITQTLSDHDRLMALVVFTSPDLHELLKRYPGKAFYNVLHPDFKGYWQFFGRVDHGTSWFFHAPVPPGTTQDNFDFRGMLHRAVGQAFALDLDYIGFWDLRFAIADSYRQGRVFIAGDAAHSHPPYGGYGINTGLEDARNLGWKLAAEVQGWGGPALLDSYDAERRPVFASTARDFIERFIHEDRAFLERHAPEADREDFERRWASRNLDAAEVNAFEPNYEGSPLVGGPGAPSAQGDHRIEARAGHHLAPQPLADGSPVIDALGRGFTLLDMGGDPALVADFRAGADEAGLPLTVVQGDPAAAWGAPLVLVRPDHFVAWAGTEGDPRGILARASGS